MKKVVLFALLAASSVGAWSADYVGASYGLSRLAGCPAGSECDRVARAFKVVAGTDAPDRLKSLGISSVEVSFSKMGKATERYSAVLPIQLQDNIDLDTLVSGRYTNERQTSAMGLSLVSRHQLSQGLSFSARFGLSYATSTRTTHVAVSYEDLDSVLQSYQGRAQEVSASKLSPLLGASIEYEMVPGTKLSTGFDITRFSVGGDTSSFWQFHFGVMQDL